MSIPNEDNSVNDTNVCEFLDGDASEECLDQLELSELMDELGFSYFTGC